MALQLDTIQETGEQVEAAARELGTEIYGVASVETFNRLFPRKPSPDKFVEGARSIIILGLPFSPEIQETIAKPWLAEIHREAAMDAALGDSAEQRLPAGAERYYHGPENDMLAHEIHMIAYRLAAQIRAEGHRAFYFPDVKIEPRFKTAPFYFLPTMFAAGMGQLGMNCCILTPEYGPRFRVTAIITDLELPAGEPPEERHYAGCQDCKECIKRCPSRAIDGSYWKNVFRCSDYGCSTTCLSVCPVGKEN